MRAAAPALPALVAALVALGAAGCGARAHPLRADAGPTSDRRPAVVAAAYPLAFVAQRVGGTRVTVRSLVKPGAEPHDVELTPRQVLQVAEADLVVYLPGLQPAVDDAVRAHARNRAVDSLAAARGSAPPSGAPPPDPHVWLDPRAMARLTASVTQRLSQVDPTGKDGYRRRGGELLADLTALDAEAGRALASCRTRTIVTAHAAFGYLAARYHLQQVAIGGVDPETESSPARISAVVRSVRGHGVSTVFVEPLVDPGAAAAVARALSARTAVLDPVEAVRGNDDYLSVMRRNLAALHQGLECS